jgi:hypothetical protein
MAAMDSSPSIGLLFFGIFIFILAVAGTCTGEAWARFGQVVYRAKNPKQFWWLVAGYYLSSVGLIGYYLWNSN